MLHKWVTSSLWDDLCAVGVQEAVERDQTVQESHCPPPLPRFARDDSFLSLAYSPLPPPPLSLSLSLSAGYPQPVRASLEDFQIKQNLQMARICDIRGTTFGPLAAGLSFTINVVAFSLVRYGYPSSPLPSPPLSLFSPSLSP